VCTENSILIDYVTESPIAPAVLADRRAAQSLPSPANDVGFNLTVGPGDQTHRSKIEVLFDHLVGGEQQPGRHGQAQRLCCFEIEYKHDTDRLSRAVTRGPMILSDQLVRHSS
jgi:hypothetical protein